MKAVVLEIRDRKAAVLTHGGQIIKVANKDYMVGQEIAVMDASERIVDIAKSAGKWMPAAVAAAFLVLVGRFTTLSMEPYGVVSLDVNPSIEFTINSRDKVLSVNGVNDDGKDIINGIDEKDLINQTIEKAVNVTIDKIESEGYMTADTNYVVIAANTVKESHTDELVSKIDTAVIENNENVEPITIKATDEEVTEARAKGTSAGKMIIVSKLDSVTEEVIDKDEWLHKSVADIVKEYDKVSDIASLTDDSKAATKPASKTSNDASDSKKETTDKGTTEVKSTPTTTPAATPTATSTPAATKAPSATATPTPTPTPVPTTAAAAVPTPTPAPSSGSTTTSPSESESPDPTAAPKPTPAPVVTPEPTPEPTPIIEPPMPEPTPEPTPIIEPPMPEPTPEPEPENPSNDPETETEAGSGETDSQAVAEDTADTAEADIPVEM
ncbi:MAG: hypothetical protein J5367_06690 [Lachnospiraceae bacterium]|nr:hypothetical protein [Lachnospiraceae bacterium]